MDATPDITKLKRINAAILLLMCFAAIYFARALLLPVVIGLLLALTLSPIVRGARRLGVAPPLTATALIVSILLTAAAAGYFLSGPVSQWMAEAPTLGAKLQDRLRDTIQSFEAVQEASEQVEEMTNGDDDVERVVVDQPGLLTSAVSNAAAFATSALVGIVLALFLLASSDLFLRKIVQAFPRLKDKKTALKIVLDIERSISRYLLSITLINMGLGVAIAAAMYLIGVPYWYLWGAIAFSLNFLPYLGAVIGTLLVGAYAIVTFPSLEYALLAPAAYLALTSLEGNIVTPYLLGRRLDLNTVAVFLNVMLWGWLWGVPGALMAVPFLVTLKVICDHVSTLKTLGNFLGAHRDLAPEVSKAEGAGADVA